MYLSSFLYSHSTETQLQLRLEELQVSCKYIFRIISTVGHCTNCNCTFYRFRSNMEVDMSLSLFSPSSSCSSLARLWSSALPVRPPHKAPPLPPRLPRTCTTLEEAAWCRLYKSGSAEDTQGLPGVGAKLALHFCIGDPGCEIIQ